MNIPDTLSHFRLAPQAPDRQHVFGWGTTPPLLHNGVKLFKESHLIAIIVVKMLFENLIALYL